MPGFCRPRRPPDRRAGQRTLANRPVGTGAPAPPRRAIRARALRASADGPRLRTRFPASADGSRPPAPNPPALRRTRLRAPPGDSRLRPSSIRRRPPPARPNSPHRLAVRARPPRILPRSGGPALAPRRRAIRACALRTSADGPRLRARFPASAGGSRPPAPNPPALRRTRPRAPPPGDSRPRPSSIRRRPPTARPIPRIGWRFAPARPESSRAPAAPPARPAARRFAPAPFEHPPTAPDCAPDSPHRLAIRARPPRILPRPGDSACAPRRQVICAGAP